MYQKFIRYCLPDCRAISFSTVKTSSLEAEKCFLHYKDETRYLLNSRTRLFEEEQNITHKTRVFEPDTR